MRGTLCILLLSLCALAQGRKRYDGHKVIVVKPTTVGQVAFLHGLQRDNDLDFWTTPRRVNQHVFIRIPPHLFLKVASHLTRRRVAFKIHSHNIQKSFDSELERLALRYQQPGQYAFNIDDFNRYEDIMQWLETVKGQCPSGVTCRTYSIGNSVEGRELKVLHISSGSGKPGYWLDSTIHAREWLAPATTLKIANHLINDYTSDSTVKEMVDKYDWYILPVMNPDGYIYTWDNERMWRKNRGANDGSDCVGTDLNRNYDDGYWGQDGTSTDPCSDIYGGSGAASEVETQVTQTEARRIGSSLKAWFTVHSAAQMYLFPWGRTDENGVCARSDDHDELMRVANAAADATENTHGSVWQRGNSCETIYAVTGATDDYVKAKASVKYAFTIELRGPGFDPPASTIPMSYEEVWNGVVAAARAIN